MNCKLLASLFVALQCCALLTGAARPVGDVGIEGRGLLDTVASASGGSSATLNAPGGGSAAASATATSRGGRVEVYAEAIAETYTEVNDGIAEAVSEAFAGTFDDGEAEAYAESFASAVGEAIAEAYADTFVEVYSDTPNGAGCGFSEANARDSATAYAEAFASAVAEATTKFSRGRLDALVLAIAAATARVEAIAYSEACVEGQVSAFSENSAYSIAHVQVYAEAFVAVLVAANDGELQLYIDGYGESVTLFEDVETGGSSDTGISGTGSGFADGGFDGSASIRRTRRSRSPRRSPSRRG